jgi:predicted small secreted protein
LNALFLADCNTMEGVIKTGGKNLEESAKENKPN